MQNKRLVSLIFAVGIGISSTVTINNLQSLKARKCTREININTTRDKVENIKDKAKESKEYREYTHQLDLKKQMYIEKLEREQNQKEENNKIPITFQMSAYCSCSYCCDTNTGITASGKNVQEGMVALPKDIPFGTKVVIPSLDKEYVCEDRGGFIEYTNEGYMRVDVFLNSHSECVKYGRFIVDGYLVYPEE